MRNKNHLLNSISGVISAIPDHVKTEDKIKPINKFFRDHELKSSKRDDLKTILQDALRQIEDRYKDEVKVGLKRLEIHT